MKKVNQNGPDVARICYIVVFAFIIFVIWQLLYHVLFMTVLRVRAAWVEQIISLLVETGGAAIVTLIVVQTLARTSRQLADLDREKEALTTMVVHDLRQPLSALLAGLSSAVKDERLPQQTRELLTIATMGGAELIRMVNDLLDISRMEAGQPLIEKTVVSPAEFIENGVHDVEQLAREKSQEIELVIPSDLPKVEVDSWRLRRVVMNIVGNAIHYSPTGGHIQVKASLPPPGERLLISVSDDGIGIPEDQQHIVFDKFAVAGNKDLSDRGSTGLGLTFCKMIVEAHGGEIWVDSRNRQGSTFTFTLPLTASTPR